MASERPIKSIATSENVIAILEGAYAKLKIGWCTYYSHRDKGALEACLKSGMKPYGHGTWIDIPGSEAWSCRGAICASGAELKLLYITGSYELLDKIDNELNVTKVEFGMSLNNLVEPSSQEEALKLFSETLDRLKLQVAEEKISRIERAVESAGMIARALLESHSQQKSVETTKENINE